MSIELHLPDLPDVPISIGPAAQRARPNWPIRVRDALSAYLPLLLMMLLALGTWWLVKNTPLPDDPREAVAPRSDPDYTLKNFTVERFAKDGRLKLRIQGDALRHYPDTERTEIDGASIRAIAPDGRATVARARMAVTNRDGSEVQLLGGARVTGVGRGGEPIEFEGEFLHAFLNTERLRSHLPVLVRHDGSEFRAAAMDYDHLSGLLQLQGRMRALLLPAQPGEARRP
jgi:lipopolysaccharide export system protein LptC